MFYPKEAPSSRQAASPACHLSFCQAKRLPYTGLSEQLKSPLRAAPAQELPALGRISGAWDARQLAYTCWHPQVPAGRTPGEAPLQNLEHRPVFTGGAVAWGRAPPLPIKVPGGCDELMFSERVCVTLGPVCGLSFPGYPVGSALSPPDGSDDLEPRDMP